MKQKSKFITNVKKTWVYVKSTKKSLIGYAFVCFTEAVMGAILPIAASRIILNITSGVANELIISALTVLVLNLILYLLFLLKSIFYQKIYQSTLVNLQMAIASETLKLEIKEIDASSSGTFIDRLNKDTKDISDMFMEYTYWMSFVLSNVGVLVAILVLNKYMFIYALITSISIYLINRKRIGEQYKIQKRIKKIDEVKTGLIGELVRGVRDIKVLNAENNLLNETKRRIVDSSNEEIKLIRVRRIYQYIENNMRSISDFVFILLGIYLYNKNLITIANFIIIYNYQSKVKNLLVGISEIAEYNKSFVVSSDRIFEVIDGDTFKKEKFGSVNIPVLHGSIKFNNVTFGYNDKKNILKDASFEINPNEKIAFIGKSGAGKSTIFSLITKLYDINSGEILLDDYNINSLSKDTIRNNMSIITQSPYIFNMSIIDNLKLAKSDATIDEIRSACKLASIDEFIMKQKKGYDTILGEGGINLSGGEKQRIAIARALLQKTEIILLDEATSSLDNETQSEIQESIANLKGEYTILIIAHRLSTVIDCDKIFVVDNGSIIDSGTHEELLLKSDFYRQLYEKDLKG